MESLRQEDCTVEVNLDFIAKPYLKKWKEGWKGHLQLLETIGPHFERCLFKKGKGRYQIYQFQLRHCKLLFPVSKNLDLEICIWQGVCSPDICFFSSIPLAQERLLKIKRTLKSFVVSSLMVLLFSHKKSWSLLVILQVRGVDPKYNVGPQRASVLHWDISVRHLRVLWLALTVRSLGHGDLTPVCLFRFFYRIWFNTGNLV